MMTSGQASPQRILLLLILLFAVTPPPLRSETPTAAVAAFDAYVISVESRLAQQHQSAASFLVPSMPVAGARGDLRVGEVAIASVPPAPIEVPGGLLHHWRATAFVPGARAADFAHLLRDVPGYPRYFAPEVVSAHLLDEQDNEMQASMRLSQRHVLTVVMDTTYDITFGDLDAQHGYSVSRSTRISEIDAAGTPAEHALTPAEEHGFLWRLNTYWSYEECNGGLYLQVETVSLTRSIPHGLGWAIGPYIDSIPRDSLAFTMRSVAQALSH